MDGKKNEIGRIQWGDGKLIDVLSRGPNGRITTSETVDRIDGRHNETKFTIMTFEINGGKIEM